MGIFDQEDISPAADDDKNRLFETVEKTGSSSRNYLRILGVVALVVIAVGAVVYYLMQPGAGDRVLAPRGLENEIRTHFLDKQKRTATDITFFYCETYYWARVDVEARADIPGNPLFHISRYRAKAVRLNDGGWDITATPLTSPEMDTPCNY